MAKAKDAKQNSKDSESASKGSQSADQRVTQKHRLAIDPLRELQRGLGNGYLQAKLTVGEPNDPYEQEADRVAEQVTRMPVPSVNRQITPLTQKQPMLEEEEEKIQSAPVEKQNQSLVQRKCSACEQEKQTPQESAIYVQSKTNSYIQCMMESRQANNDVASEVEAGIEQARGGGQPLERTAQQQMESAFGSDFSRVRVHTGAGADALNEALNARAFTTGQDIFFRQGEYNPGSTSGKKLLAHELTHVVQQTGGLRPKIQAKCTACELTEDNEAHLLQRQLSSNLPPNQLQRACEDVTVDPPAPYNNLPPKLLETLGCSFKEHTKENKYLVNGFSWDNGPPPLTLWQALDRISAIEINALVEVYQLSKETPGLWDHISRVKNIWVGTSRGTKFVPTSGEAAISDYLKRSPHFCEDEKHIALMWHDQYCSRQLGKGGVPGLHVCLGNNREPDIHIDMHQATTGYVIPGTGLCLYKPTSAFGHWGDLLGPISILGFNILGSSENFFNRVDGQINVQEKRLRNLQSKTTNPPCEAFIIMTPEVTMVQNGLNELRGMLKSYAIKGFEGEQTAMREQDKPMKAKFQELNKRLNHIETFVNSICPQRK